MTPGNVDVFLCDDVAFYVSGPRSRCGLVSVNVTMLDVMGTHAVDCRREQQGDAAAVRTYLQTAERSALLGHVQAPASCLGLCNKQAADSSAVLGSWFRQSC